jgi:hypothetical protein
MPENLLLYHLIIYILRVFLSLLLSIFTVDECSFVPSAWLYIISFFFEKIPNNLFVSTLFNMKVSS